MIICDHNTLWGMSGGQLEFVSQRTETKDGKKVCIIRFTDHDVHWGDHEELIEGKYYELEFPFYEG